MRIPRGVRYVSTIAPSKHPPLISIDNGTFYRHHPSAIKHIGHESIPNPPLFLKLQLSLPSFSQPNQHWAVISASSSSRTTFLQILRGQHLCFPPTARSYPYLATDEIAAKDSRLRFPAHAIQYVGFDAERGGLGGTSTRGAYLSARYESRREETDFSLLDYLNGDTELNAAEDMLHHPPKALLDRVIADLKLQKLVQMPVSNLSNGQTRRARIAKALLSTPEMLLLDGPFMGLDPPTLLHLSSLLHRLGEAQSPRLVLSLKPDDDVPSWITHLALLDEQYTVLAQGSKPDVFQYISDQYYRAISASKHTFEKERKVEGDFSWLNFREIGQEMNAKGYLPPPNVDYYYATKAVEDGTEEKTSVDGFPAVDATSPDLGDAVVEMEGVQVRYGDKCVLGDWQQQDQNASRPGLYWQVCQGQRWGVFGPNGSGKTTLLALLTSDHPQSYSAPMKLFGRSRLPQPGKPGLSLWDIQARLGHSSPEVHTFFPRKLSVRRALESAWADTPLASVKLTHEIDRKVDAALRWFQAELMPSLGLTAQQRDEATRINDPYRPGGRPRRSLEFIVKELDKYDQQPGFGLEWADDTLFGEVSFSAQRVLLFLRAVIRNPEFVVLDEAFSGMDEPARDKCLLFLSHGEAMTRALIQVPAPGAAPKGKSVSPAAAGMKTVESDISKLGRLNVKGLQPNQALLVVSHNPAEVPGCVREWICLPEPGEGREPRIGRLDGPLSMSKNRWKEIWGMA